MHQIWKCTKKLIAIKSVFCCTQLCTVCSYGTRYLKHQTLDNAKCWGDMFIIIYK